MRHVRMFSMPRRRLTRDWSLVLDNSFRGRVVGEDLQFLSVEPWVRTIWLSLWQPSIEDSPDETLAWILEDVHPSPESRFREQSADGEEVRYASWYHEVVDGRGAWGLYAYTVRRGSYVQIALLSDESSDLPWALETWRSVHYHSEF
jgi:hypothetical protein